MILKMNNENEMVADGILKNNPLWRVYITDFFLVFATE